jgi:hypothetical protein
MISTMAEHHQSLICRGASAKVVETFSKAIMMTFMSRDHLPGSFWQAMFRPKVLGGFGVWLGVKRHMNKAPKRPAVMTRVKIKRDGRFGAFGTAHMTDSLLSLLSAKFSYPVENLATERDEMVGEVLESSLGPEKYGTRRYDNAAIVLKYLTRLSPKQDKSIVLDGGSVTKAFIIAEQLMRLLNDPNIMRHEPECTPAEVITRTLQRSGCVNESLYKRIHGIRRSDTSGYINSLLRGVAYGVEVDIVNGLATLPDSEARLFYLDRFGVAFWRVDERINTEVGALVRNYVLQCVSKDPAGWRLKGGRTLNKEVEWEWILTLVARTVWEIVKCKLELVSF